MPVFVNNQPLPGNKENDAKIRQMNALHSDLIRFNNNALMGDIKFVIEQLDKIAKETQYNTENGNNFDTDTLLKMIREIMNKDNEAHHKNTWDSQGVSASKSVLEQLPKLNDYLSKYLRQQFDRLDCYIRANKIDVKKYDHISTSRTDREYDFQTDINIEEKTADNLYEQLRNAVAEYQRRVDEYIKKHPVSKQEQPLQEQTLHTQNPMYEMSSMPGLPGKPFFQLSEPEMPSISSDGTIEMPDGTVEMPDGTIITRTGIVIKPAAPEMRSSNTRR